MNKLYQYSGPRHAREFVGLFVLIGLAALLGAIVHSAYLQRWFNPGRTLRVILPQQGLYGLSAGSEVYVLGTDAGTVREIEIDPETGRIVAEVNIEPKFTNYIRTDSVATIRRKLAVAGDSYLDISRGAGEPLDWDLAVIEATVDTGPTDLINQVLVAVEERALPAITHLDEAAIQIRDLVRSTNDPQGSFQQALAHTAAITGKINSGQGSIGRLVNNDRLARQVQGTVEDLRSSLSKLQPALADLNAATQDLASVAKAAESRSDQIPEIIQGMDKSVEQLQEILADVRKTSTDLPQISRNLNQASQTLPTVVLQAQQTLKRFEQLARKASGSWLLGGAGTPEQPQRRPDPAEAKP
jgi:phospholipid/cholesterol/gamma-HCH transport system substrate-binding protein